ncbi:MAG: polymorphic toxin type 44 domain-containing protein, partial [Campylobacter sp.]|uniref:polymorphic toxin type 44 domain-containing protein n=1 Tax=Campylobacter sp. TaxID=205 RepID=UPI002AA7D063
MSFNFKGDIPNGVNIKGNVAQGNGIRKPGDSSKLGKIEATVKFYNLVKSGGPMDYKTQGSQYEDFGNYNYGAMARAMGIDENPAKAGAAAQQARNIMKAALNNGEEWLDNNLSPEDREKYGKYYDTAKNIKENNPYLYDFALLQYFLDESMKIGDETGDYGYLDDPKDQKYIDDGYRDAKDSGYGNDLEPITFDDFSELDNLGKHFFDLDDGRSMKDLANALAEALGFFAPQWLKDFIADLYDPIALDLNNNGKIDTLSLENGVFFDHNGDDIAFKSSWISGGDGILARDINGDKEINSGAELFGNFTRLKNGELAKNGAEALKDLDDNNDGIFDSNDKAFNEILVWQDFNSNGKAESGELKSLSEHGIKSINL